MNEIILSQDLMVLEEEINSYFELGKKSIWEIGKRLKHIKENDLTHGNFMTWCESRMNMTSKQVNKYIVVYEEFPNWKSTPNLGLENLYLTTKLESERKEEEMRKIERGENSTVRELKKQLKEQSEQHQRQLAEKDEVINKTYEQLEKAQQEPTVIKKEVIPEDYEKIKQENEQLKQSNQKLQRDLEWVQDDLKLKQTQYSLLESSTAEAKELERKIQSLQSQEKTIVEKMEAVETFYELERNFNDFFDTKMAPMRFKGIANHLYATNAVDRIRSMITQAELWAEEMNKILPNKNMKILEGEIIND